MAKTAETLTDTELPAAGAIAMPSELQYVSATEVVGPVCVPADDTVVVPTVIDDDGEVPTRSTTADVPGSAPRSSVTLALPAAQMQSALRATLARFGHATAE